MTKAGRVHKVGGPEALVYESVDVPAPGPGEVRIRQHPVGLNLLDVYYRTGLHHAAAGGIGLLACQWARAMGAHVIGTVGSREKAELAEANGCDHVILYNEEDFVARVKQISRNEGCDVVYDGVGKATFPGSLSCLKPRGMFVSFGNASGPVPPFSIAELNNHGSLFATRPKLNDYVGTRKELLEGTNTLFAAVINGKLHVPLNHASALKDVAKAHIELEGRATTGAAILRP